MATPFRFALDRVLTYREQQEEQARMTLAASQAAYRLQTERLRALEETIRTNEEAMSGAKSMTQGELWLLVRYRDRLAGEREEESRRLQSLARELAERRRAAVERARERKALEKLKMKRFLEHRKEHEAKEQRQIDEMATLRYSRQDL
jgi:flagellar protein FliJ